MDFCVRPGFNPCLCPSPSDFLSPEINILPSNLSGCLMVPMVYKMRPKPKRGFGCAIIVAVGSPEGIIRSKCDSRSRNALAY